MTQRAFQNRLMTRNGRFSIRSTEKITLKITCRVSKHTARKLVSPSIHRSCVSLIDMVSSADSLRSSRNSGQCQAGSRGVKSLSPKHTLQHPAPTVCAHQDPPPASSESARSPPPTPHAWGWEGGCLADSYEERSPHVYVGGGGEGKALAQCPPQRAATDLSIGVRGYWGGGSQKRFRPGRPDHPCPRNLKQNACLC
jgi:hypothetical protein